MRRVAISLVAAASGLAGLALVRASQADQSHRVFHSSIDVVPVDVAVFDRQHRPITGLATEDFIVLEDGRPSEVVAFSAVEVPEPTSDSAAWTRDVTSDVITNHQSGHRTLVIVFDDQQMPSDPAVRKAAVRVATETIDRLGPRDEAAVIFTGSGRSQNFTSNRVALRQAAESLVPHPAGIGQDPRRTVGTLQNALAVLSAAPAGRRILLYVGEAPAFGMVRSSGLGLSALMDRFTEANIALYTFDVAGLRTFQRGVGGRGGAGAPMGGGNRGRVVPPAAHSGVLGARTGGRDIEGTNDPWDGVGDVFADTRSYYVLAFERAAPDDGNVHSIEVRVSRPDVEVWSRTGYQAPRPASDAIAASGSATISRDLLDRALSRGVPSTDIPLRVAITPIAAADGRNVILVIASGIGRLPGAPDGSEEPRRVNLVASAFDANLREVQTQRESVGTSGQRSNAGLEAVSELSVPPGRYEVRVAVEAGGRTGSVFVDVDAPNLATADFALSGLFLSRQSGRAADPGNGVTAAVPIVPTASRAFARSDQVKVFARVYEGGNGHLRPVEVLATVLNAQGDEVFRQALPVPENRFADTRRADVAVALPTSRLANGEYLVTLEAGGCPARC